VSSCNLGTLTSWNPLGHPRPETGLLYLYRQRELQKKLKNKELFLENRAVYEILWKDFVGPGRPQMTIWRMIIAIWIPKATNTHSECVILIAF